MIGGYQIIDVTKYPLAFNATTTINNKSIYKQIQNFDKVPIIKCKIIDPDGDVGGSYIFAHGYGTRAIVGDTNIIIINLGVIGSFEMTALPDGQINISIRN